MADVESFDAILIGSGQANNPLAHALAGDGWRVALIERKHVAGTCINEGCTPSKTMIASGRVAYQARRAGEFGVEIGPVSVDLRKIRERKRDIVERFRRGNRRRLEEAEGIELLMGEGRFTGSNTVEVRLLDGPVRRLTAGKVFINTGQRPRVPSLRGLEIVPFLDSTSVMELAEVPDHLLIIGGGYIGVEFGQLFRRLGSDVTIVQRGSQVLSHEDEDIAEAVIDILREDGVEVLLNTEADRVVGPVNGSVQIMVDTPEGERELEGSRLLLAVGRVPNTDELNLEAAGVETDERGYIKVNDRLETTADGVYALGDVKGGPAFTHVSYDDFRIVRDNLLREGDASTESRVLTYTVFMDPQLGRVGMTEEQARAAGHDVRVAKMPMAHVARAIETNETRGVMKAVVDADSDQILGAAVLGVEGGEVASVLKVAMLAGLPYQAIMEEMFPHPTLSESLNNLFMTLD